MPETPVKYGLYKHTRMAAEGVAPDRPMSVKSGHATQARDVRLNLDNVAKVVL
jgi:hypothetical protein